MLSYCKPTRDFLKSDLVPLPSKVAIIENGTASKNTQFVLFNSKLTRLTRIEVSSGELIADMFAKVLEIRMQGKTTK